jgi:phosphohistidine phosphatase
MKTVALLRHAKSSWDDPDLRDHDRPLAPRGVRAAALIGRRLAEDGFDCDLILCSSARRALATVDLVRAAGPEPVATAPVLAEPGLYLTGATALFDRLKRLPETVTAVMLVAHNPDLHTLAVRLAGHGDRDRLGALRAKLPTAGFALLKAPVPVWPALEDGIADLTRFLVPKTLS